jgi:hypothetical protein
MDFSSAYEYLLLPNCIVPLKRHSGQGYLNVAENVTKLSFYLINGIDFGIMIAELCLEYCKH